MLGFDIDMVWIFMSYHGWVYVGSNVDEMEMLGEWLVNVDVNGCESM